MQIDKLELGCGKKPTNGYQHHDSWKHSSYIDLTFDLEKLPWPLENESCGELLAIDVFEHLRPWIVPIQDWLAECWRVLKLGGKLTLRLPAYDNHYTWRDPQHNRAFHHETLNYFSPNCAGDCWGSFGSYYYGPDYNYWWFLESSTRECNDIKVILRKHIYPLEELAKIRLNGRI